ncbi:MAG: phosphoglycerate mutase family protein [Pseudomonadota bacterium]
MLRFPVAMPRVTRRRTRGLSAFFALLAIAACSAVPPLTPATSVTVYVVRHAEKATDDRRDPTLSTQGKRRAEALASEILATSPNTASVILWSSDYRRTRQTLAPLAEALGVSINVYDAQDSRALVRAIMAQPDGVHVVAGHSNTVPEIVDGLSAWPAAPATLSADLPYDRYDRLFVVRRGSGYPVRVEERRYFSQ